MLTGKGPGPVGTLSSDPATPDPSPTKNGNQGPGPLSDLTKAGEQLASYERKLSGARASRAEILAELARLCFTLGEWGAEAKNDRKNYFEKGRDYAKLLIRENPYLVAGHYWLALNLGGLAEMSGARRDLRLVPIMVQELIVAATIDGAYNQAGPHRVLGRIYCMAPAWPMSVGDLNKSVKHLRIAVGLAPENSSNHLYLAETLIQMGKVDQACQELNEVRTSTTHANWVPGLEEDRQKASRLLRECKPATSSR